MEIKNFRLALVPIAISMVGILMLAISVFTTKQSGTNLVLLSQLLVKPNLSLSSSGRTLVSSLKVNSGNNKGNISISQIVSNSISNQLMLDQIRSSAINYQPSSHKR